MPAGGKGATLHSHDGVRGLQLSSVSPTEHTPARHTAELFPESLITGTPVCRGWSL